MKDILNIIKCCLNPKVIMSILVLIAVFYFFAPQLLKYSSLLVILICPLSMGLMMMGMNKMNNKETKDKDIESNNQNHTV